MADSAPTGGGGGRLTDKTHAVLKLQLGDNGGIRRINFSRLWCPASQTVQYDKLVALAREYSTPAISPIEQADVTITYLDEDGDTITISSDDELAEAFLQFVDRVPPVLRASATVKCCSKQKPEVEVEANQPKEEKDEKQAKQEEDQPKEEDSSKPSTMQFVTTGDEHSGPTLREPAGSSERTGRSSTNVPPPEPLQQVEVILKGVASMLGSVVSSFNQQANGHNTSTSQRQTNASTTRNVDPGTEEAERFVREVINNIHMAGSGSTSAPSSSFDATVPADNCGLAAFDSAFIHGFHTCDGCAKKPIVGYRFHATNRPDFDLCMNCHADESKCRDAEGIITFEPSELDRDRPLQLRWKSLHDSTKDAEAKSAANDADGPCTHFIHGRHTCDGCLTTPIIGLRWHSVNLPDYDLCDRCKNNYKGDEIEFETVELERDRAFQTRWQRRQVRRARQARFAHSRYAERSRCGRPMSSAQAAAAAAAASIRTASSSSDAAATEAKKGTEVMDVALKEAIRRSLADADTNGANSNSKIEADKDTPENEIEVEDDKPHETVTEDAPKAASSSNPQYVQEAPRRRTKKEDADEAMVATPASAKSNFSEEAEHLGAAAEHLGVVLDECAECIDAMVSELDDSKVAEKYPPENPSSVPPLEDGDAPDSVSAMTSSILSSEEPKKVAEEENKNLSEDDDEWSMVSESSEALAKATKALGSALFDIDKKSSTELAESGIDSVPSSVPTVSSSTPQWTEELKKLHEFGFTDDNASIAALELLNKDAEAPVPIENVVDYLCVTADSNDDEADD